MAISEKNKEIITKRLADRIEKVHDAWRKASEMVIDIAEKAEVFKMISLCSKQRAKIDKVDIKYHNGTPYESHIQSTDNWDGLYFDVYHNNISGWQRIGKRDGRVYEVKYSDLIGRCSTAYESAVELVTKLIDNDADSFIKEFNLYGEDFVKNFFDDVCDAMNKYLVVLTKAYNIALQRERENDAKILSAFGLDDGSVIKVEPKQFKVAIEEVKGE